MEKINTHNTNAVKALIEQSENICLIGHHNPDGDALAGCLGMSRILQKLNKKPAVVMPSDLPDYLKFLPGANEIIVHRQDDDSAQKALQNADLIFCIDFNSAARVRNLEQDLLNSPAKKIMLDHHPQPEDFTDYVMSEEQCSSASEIVANFIEMLGYKSLTDKETAYILYTGIMTDTLNFSIKTAGENTFRRVADLLSFGIDKEEIFNQVYNTYSWDRLKLTGHLINNETRRIAGHPVAYTLFSIADKEQYNYKIGDHEGIVNSPLSVHDIQASFLFMENDNKIKVSARSKIGFNVNEFARRFLNGGGHERAAGGTLKIPMSEIPEYLKNALDEYEKTN